MIKPSHLLISLLIGILIGYFLFSSKDETKTDFKVLDSLHNVIKKDKKDLIVLQDTLKEKDKELEDAHIKRILAEKRAKAAEAKYALAKTIKPPVTHKDSIVYLSVANADCDTLNTSLKQLVLSYAEELDKSQGTLITLQGINKRLTSENETYAKADSVHMETEKALVKKARKNLFKGGLFGLIGGILVALIL